MHQNMQNVHRFASDTSLDKQCDMIDVFISVDGK